MINSKGYDIFLSYARDDSRDLALRVKKALGLQGWSVFMDEADIPNAEPWERYLRQQLEDALCVLVLWSPRARESKWVLEEAGRAEERKVLVHASLDGIKPPGQFEALQADRLASWIGRGYPGDDSEFRSLLRAIAGRVGPKGPLGTLLEPAPYENVTEAHLALTSSSWRVTGEKCKSLYPYQIHLRLVGAQTTLKRVENVIYYFDPAYAQNRPDLVNSDLAAYVKMSQDWRSGFTVYECANGYSVVQAEVKIKEQDKVLRLSRLVDIMEQGPWLKKLYPIDLSDDAQESATQLEESTRAAVNGSVPSGHNSPPDKR